MDYYWFISKKDQTSSEHNCFSTGPFLDHILYLECPTSFHKFKGIQVLISPLQENFGSNLKALDREES